MKDFHKKESPFQGISGLAGGATGLRMAGVSALPPKYVDEVFSTGSRAQLRDCRIDAREGSRSSIAHAAVPERSHF